MREATRQQKLFIDEYIRGRKKNQTKAAIAAGYSEKSAYAQAYQLLQNPIVLKYLHEKERELAEQLQNEFVFDAMEARKVMADILADPTARNIDRITVAKDFLDRAGFKPTDKQQIEHQGQINVNNPFDNLTEDELRKLIEGV